MRYYHYLDNEIVKISASFLLPIMFRASFDLILLENDLVLSLYLWVIICVGLMVCNGIDKVTARNFNRIEDQRIF
jgi:hypothetical protein